MIEADRIRELLFADVALTLGAADAREVANALQRYWESDAGAREPVAAALQAAGVLTQEQRDAAEAEVERLVGEADGDLGVALARRGGIDRSIHTSLRPETSTKLMQNGAGARAPLRVVDEDRYRDFTLVGKGGMGVVYLALDTELNRRVAFKMVRPDPSAPKETPAPQTPLRVTPPSIDVSGEDHRSFEELRIRFLQEAWVTGAMEHPGVVPVYELGKTAAGIPYYTMRYVKGERTLATAIKDAEELDARLALLEPFLKICDTVRYAHARGVMHRDLKPENIALGEFGEAIVLDWGLSKMEGRPDISGSLWRSRIEEYRDATDLQTVAGALGTPGYMAPEAALGKSDEVDARSDVYSLGAMLFEILTRQLPVRFKTFVEYVQKMLADEPPLAHEIYEAVPKELSRICVKALSRGKEERFESVDEMARAIRRWQTEGRLAQQIEQMVLSARNEIDAARRHAGNMMLWHLDRASAACTRVLHMKKDHPDALALTGEIKELREKGIKERVSAGRRKVIVTVGFAILAIATIVALNFANILSKQREEAEGRVKAEQETLAAKEREVRSARLAEKDAQRRRAALYSGMSRRYLATGSVAAARLAAAQSIVVAPTPGGYRALAAAEARWTPTLARVVDGLRPGPVEFAPDGTRLYVCAREGVRALLTATGKTAATFAAGEVGLLAVSPDGSRLCTVSTDGKPKVWDTVTGKLVATLTGDVSGAAPVVRRVVEEAGPVTAVAFGQVGDRLYTGHFDGTLIGWNHSLGLPTSDIVDGQDGAAITAMRIGKNGRYLYTGNARGGVSQRPVIRLIDETSYDMDAGPVRWVAGSDDGASAYACTDDHTVYMIDLEGLSQWTQFEGPEKSLQAIVPSHDLERLYTADRRGAVAIWDKQNRTRIAVLEEFRGDVTGFALSGGGGRLAVAAKDGTVRIWDLRMRWDARGSELAETVFVSADSARSYVARPDHTIEVWDNAKGERVHRVGGHHATVTAIAADADGGHIFTTSLDGTLRIWTIAAEAESPALVQKTVFQGPDFPTALAVEGKGDLVYCGNIDGVVEIWSTLLKRQTGRLPEPFENPVAALRIEKRRIVAWDTAGESREWDLDTKKRLEAETRPLPAAAPVYAKGPPIHGSRLPWISKDPMRRLIGIENRFGLKLDGVAAVAVPLDEYAPRRPRIDPWSR